MRLVLVQDKVFGIIGAPMKIDVSALPNDPQLLREVLGQVLEELAKAEAKYLALFNRLFRPRSEKLNEDQLSFAFESLAEMGISQEQLEELEQ